MSFLLGIIIKDDDFIRMNDIKQTLFYYINYIHKQLIDVNAIIDKNLMIPIL